jgi:hypothetical protein
MKMAMMKPAQVTMQLEVIDHVRKTAEHEQQQPDPQIDPDGMLLSFAMRRVRGIGAVRSVNCLIHKRSYQR